MSDRVSIGQASLEIAKHMRAAFGTYHIEYIGIAFSDKVEIYQVAETDNGIMSAYILGYFRGLVDSGMGE